MVTRLADLGSFYINTYISIIMIIIYIQLLKYMKTTTLIIVEIKSEQNRYRYLAS